MEYTSKKLPDGSLEITTRLSAAFLQASRKEAAARDLDLVGDPVRKYLVTCPDGVSHMIWAVNDLHAFALAFQTCGGEFGSLVPLLDPFSPPISISFEAFIEASTGAVRRALAARRRESPGESSPVGPITIGIQMEPDSGKLDVKRETSGALSDLRSLALMAGDFHRRLLREIPSLIKLTPDEVMRRAQDALGELRSSNLLTDAEAASLTKVLEVIRNPNMTALQIAEQIRTIFLKLRAAEAGPTALGIMSIAMDSIEAAATDGPGNEAGLLNGKAGLIAIEDIGGACIGGAICAKGGAVGVTLGLIGGAAVASGLVMAAS